MKRRFGLRGRLILAFAAAATFTVLFFGATVIGSLHLGEIQNRARAVSEAVREDEAEDERRDIVRVLWSMLIALPISAALAGALGIWLGRRAVAPLHEASSRAEQARTSALALRLPVTGTDADWDGLAETLNRLLEEARGSMERIQRFTGDAAHELRTPIYAILGEAEVTLRRDRSPEELRESLGHVRTDALRVSQIVESLLLLARADEGSLTGGGRAAQLRVLTPVRAVAAAVAARRVRMGTANDALRFSFEGPETVVSINVPLFEQVFENLFKNAGQYGAHEVRVISSQDASGRAVIDVQDDGPGIPAELTPRLFERFARATPSRTGDGHGLGLAICKAIVEAHGGKLSYVEGKPGAHFRLELPAAN